MWLLILAFLKKYWYVVLGPILLLSVYFYGYSRGYNKAQNKVAQEAIKELVERQKEVVKENKKNTTAEKKIKSHRIDKPIDDRRDGCLLSNDPFKTDCLKS